MNTALRAVCNAATTAIFATLASAQLALVSPATAIPTEPWGDLVFDSGRDRMLLINGSGTLALDYGTTNTWTNLNAAPPLSPVRFVDGNPPLAFDTVNGLVYSLPDPVVGNAWSAAAVLGQKPSSRVFCGLARLPNGNVLLFGGQDSSGLLNDTHLYDDTTGHWSQLQPTTSPSARSAMAMCGTDQGAILCGGGDATTVLSETWVFDLAQQNWINLQKPLPTAVLGCETTFDQRTRRVIMQGGATSQSNLVRDIATLDLNVATQGWALLANSSGAAMDLPRLAYSPAHDETILVEIGTNNGSFDVVQDTTMARIPAGCDCGGGGLGLITTTPPVRVGALQEFTMFRGSPTPQATFVFLGVVAFSPPIALAAPFGANCVEIVDFAQAPMIQSMTPFGPVTSGVLKANVQIPPDPQFLGLEITAQAAQSSTAGTACTTDAVRFQLRR